jgi:hypothetical protein
VRNLLLMSFTLLLACAGAPPTSHAEHSGGGHHGHHDHSDPGAIVALMVGLKDDLTAVRAALQADDLPTAEKHATAIAKACEGVAHGTLDAAHYGPRFAEFDKQLLAGAADLAQRAQSADASAVRSAYTDLVATCVGCHNQAPAAGHVDLSDLKAP